MQTQIAPAIQLRGGYNYFQYGADDTSVPVPDIQATAIRLKDAAIVGQASASDVIGKGIQAGRAVRQFSVQDITEATAIALMEDMLTGKK